MPDNIVYTAEVDFMSQMILGFTICLEMSLNGHPPYYNESYEFNTTFNPDV